MMNFNKDIAVRPAAFDDAAALANLLRDADVEEIRAATGFDPLAGLLDSLEASTITQYATFKNQPLAMFGVRVIEAGGEIIGMPWMLGSDLIAQIPISLMRYSRHWLAELEQNCTWLRNYVLSSHQDSISYLQHLGFSFDAPVTLGPEQKTFLPFYKNLKEKD